MRILSVRTLLKQVKQTQSINTGFQGSLLEVGELPFSVSKAASSGVCQTARREKEKQKNPSGFYSKETSIRNTCKAIEFQHAL